MNAAYYTQSIVNLSKAAINYDDKTIVFRRTKNTEHRSCVLWDETIEAMKEYERNLPPARQTFFISNNYRKKFSKTTISTKFRECKEKANITSNISHQNFRDSVPSICKQNEVYVPSIKAVMGHKPSGELKSYEDPEIYPNLAKEACQAVHDYYFG